MEREQDLTLCPVKCPYQPGRFCMSYYNGSRLVYNPSGDPTKAPYREAYTSPGRIEDCLKGQGEAGNKSNSSEVTS